MTEKKRLVREEGTVRPSAGRLERGERAPQGSAHDHADRNGRRAAASGERGGERGGGGTARRGRPPLVSEFNDINRGILYVGVESAAIAMDVASRVLRGAVDRAFDEDYSSPGDIIRGVAGETDLAVYDLVAELRNVPRRLTHRFDEAIRSPRAEQGERDRRQDGATTPADSPAAKPEGRS
jgi:hypothetical protein